MKKAFYLKAFFTLTAVPMRLTELKLYNFRNIEQAEIQTHRFFNIFYGLNAQGKTNLLESICLLGSLKSFRASRNDDLIRRGSSEARIKGRSIRNLVADEMRLDIDRDGKTARLNGKIVSQPDNYLNCLRPVVFSPEEVSLAKGGPAGRRRLVDRAVFQADPGFLTIVQSYERQLKQRNRLLKDKKSEAELAPWTEALVQAGAAIRLARKNYIESLKPVFSDCYREISGGCERAELVCKSDGSSLEEIQRSFSDELKKQREQERKYGMTLCGPHRDDVFFLLDDHSLRDFGSQGQQRSFILALKTAQVLDLENRFGEPPLLLLDDFLGELDRQRQNYFFQFLLKMQGQVFITTTDMKPLTDSGISEAAYFQVKGGVLHTRHK